MKREYQYSPAALSKESIAYLNQLQEKLSQKADEDIVLVAYEKKERQEKAKA